MFAYQRVEKVQLQISTRWETSRKRDKFRILRAGAVRGYCPRAKDGKCQKWLEHYVQAIFL